MRLQPTTIEPRVTRNPRHRRPILLAIGSHTYGLSPAEAHTLADQLHDAAETRTR